MHKRIGQMISRSYHFMNRLPQAQVHDLHLDLKPLFISKGFEEVYNDLPNLTNENHIEVIQRIPDASEIYNKMVPYNFVASLTDTVLNWVVKASYNKSAKVIELYVMDTSGVYKKYINLEYFIPITYSDMVSMLVLNVPFNEMIDIDMIFKNSETRDVFLFDKKGEWNEETCNLPDFEFSELFNENEWIDKQMPKLN